MFLEIIRETFVNKSYVTSVITEEISKNKKCEIPMFVLKFFEDQKDMPYDEKIKILTDINLILEDEKNRIKIINRKLYFNNKQIIYEEKFLFEIDKSAFEPDMFEYWNVENEDCSDDEIVKDALPTLKTKKQDVIESDYSEEEPDAEGEQINSILKYRIKKSSTSDEEPFACCLSD